MFFLKLFYDFSKIVFKRPRIFQIFQKFFNVSRNNFKMTWKFITRFSKSLMSSCEIFSDFQAWKFLEIMPHFFEIASKIKRNSPYSFPKLFFLVL